MWPVFTSELFFSFFFFLGGGKLISELVSSGTPWVRKSVNYPSKKIWQSRDRALTVRLHHSHTNAKFRVVCGKGFFGAKTNGNPRVVKQKQLRGSGKSIQKKKKFFRNYCNEIGSSAFRLG